jgi:DUF1680 family protein
MSARKVLPNEHVKEIAGKVAVERGPIVYCAEQADNPKGVLTKTVSASAGFKPVFSDELQGVVKLVTEDNFTLVPYYSWSHRGPGEMAVWFELQ